MQRQRNRLAGAQHAQRNRAAQRVDAEAKADRPAILEEIGSTINTKEIVDTIGTKEIVDTIGTKEIVDTIGTKEIVSAIDPNDLSEEEWAALIARRTKQK